MFVLSTITGIFKGKWLETNSIRIAIEVRIGNGLYEYDGYVRNAPEWHEIFTTDRIGEEFMFEGEIVANGIIHIHNVLPGRTDNFVLNGAL